MVAIWVFVFIGFGVGFPNMVGTFCQSLRRN